MDIGNNNQMRVNHMDLPNVKCENCENIFYNKVTIIKKVSKLLTGAVTDELIPMETYRCTECSHINKDFNILGNEE
mgnify:CR=1 FL=1